MSSEAGLEPRAPGGATPPLVPAPGEAGPVGADERLILLDVLRGFALGGVFLSNLYMWFSGRVFLPKEQLKAAFADPMNRAVGLIFTFFIFGKLITIFSFLFGLGFTLQTDRVEQRGARAGRLYVRRLSIMILLGAVHTIAIWYGDILHVYALLGFLLLLLFRRRSDRVLLIWGLVFALLAHPVYELAAEYLPRLWRSPEALAAEEQVKTAQRVEWNAWALAAFRGGSYPTMMRANVEAYWQIFVGPSMVAVQFSILGRFLFGVYAGRHRLLHDVSQHRRLFRRLLGWGFLAGLIGNGTTAILRVLRLSDRLAPDSHLPKLVGPLAGEIGALGFAAFYVAGMALLFQRERWRRALSLLAPAGQMALTNYLGQSVLGMLIFCGVGLGLMGEVSGPACFGIVFGLFSAQILCSHLWLARFRFGPVEWLWRSLTYGKAQPLRRETERPAQAEALT